MNLIQNSRCFTIVQSSMMKTTIGERVAYKETISNGLGVTEYKDKKAKEEIEALRSEIEAIIKNF